MSLPTMILTMAMLLSGVAGQVPDPNKLPIFAYPPDGSSNTYNKMDTVMVTYTWSYDTAVLWTFCDPGVGRLIYQQRAPGNTATVPILLNFTSATPCWFNVRTGEDGMNSAYFNLISEERSGGPMVFGLEADSQTSSTSTTSTASSSTSSSSSSGTIGGSPAAATANDSGSSNSSSTGGSAPDPDPTGTDDASSSGEERGSAGLSAGASAGIGIGAAIGTIAVAGGAFMMWRRLRQRRGAAARAEKPEMGANGWPGYFPDTRKSAHGAELCAVDTRACHEMST